MRAKLAYRFAIGAVVAGLSLTPHVSSVADDDDKTATEKRREELDQQQRQRLEKLLEATREAREAETADPSQRRLGGAAKGGGSIQRRIGDLTLENDRYRWSEGDPPRGRSGGSTLAVGGKQRQVLGDRHDWISGRESPPGTMTRSRLDGTTVTGERHRWTKD